MPLVLPDRVKETTSTTGTGTITLAGTSSGFQSFAAVGNANTTYYCIAHQTANEWEVGIGTYTLSGTTLARNTVLSSSNAGALVNFSAGVKDAFVTYPATRSIYADGTVLQTTNSAVLPIISGGTGATTAATARTNFGATTVGANLFTLANPTAIRFLRVNADNTVSALDAATFRTAIGAGTSSTTGTVTSVAVSGGTTGLTTSGGPITTSGTITLAGTLAIANGGTGSTTAAAARTALGATTLGSNLFTITNPSAITFPRFNADNTISSLNAADFRTAIGAGTSSTTGTVTSVGGTGTVSGLSLSGTVTTSGNLTLGGTLAVLPSNFASQTAKTVLAAPNAAAGVPTFRLLVASDIPTLNQNTTGTAAISTAATVTTSTTASAFKVPFANTTASTTGNYGLLQDSTATFTYNPSTNTLVVGTVSGALSGTATSATNIAGGAVNRIPVQSGAGATTFVVAPTTGSTFLQWTGSAFAWAGAAQAGAGGAIVENTRTIAANYTLTTNYNGMSAGPITINSGVTVTVPSGASWVIV